MNTHTLPIHSHIRTKYQYHMRVLTELCLMYEFYIISKHSRGWEEEINTNIYTYICTGSVICI